ncbi:MAG: hypothetical protein K5872_22035 [Rhizobiaceae bacterium]|nr:hypothetical protein [Rhizobiaceae bacterium]MCV0408900.1 hypothetical protein [Rhizobiaceae bacterium]
MRVSDAPSIETPEVDEAVPGIGHNRPTVTDLFRDQCADLIEAVEKLATRANAERDKLGADKISSDDERDTFTSIGVEAAKLVKRVEARREEILQPLRNEISEWNALFGTDRPAQGSLKYRLNAMKGYASTIVGRYDEEQREIARKKAAEEAEAARKEAERRLEEAAAIDSAKSVTQDVALQEAAAADHRARHLERQALSAGAGPTRTDAGTISQATAWDFRIVDASRIDLNKLRPHIPLADIEKAIRKHVRANRDTVPIAGVEIFQTTRTQFRG